MHRSQKEKKKKKKKTHTHTHILIKKQTNEKKDEMLQENKKH